MYNKNMPFSYKICFTSSIQIISRKIIVIYKYTHTRIRNYNIINVKCI